MNPSIHVGGVARSVAARKDRKVPAGVCPTTSTMNYTDDESEFLRAMSNYIQRTGRKFPTWSEALGVMMTLGYHK